MPPPPSTALPTLLLLPGLLCDAASWSDIPDRLAGRAGCQIPDWGTLDCITAMAQHALASCPAERFALAGHSMGGRVALEMVRLAPQRVDRLALLDTGIDALPQGDVGAAERARRMALVMLARRDGMRVMGRAWAHGMVHPSSLDTPLFDAILDMIERKSPAVFEAQVAALLARPDARDTLRNVECPLLLACGRDDSWSPLARHQQMHDLVPGSTLDVFDRAGHMAPMEQPAAVAAVLGAWLAAPPEIKSASASRRT